MILTVKQTKNLFGGLFFFCRQLSAFAQLIKAIHHLHLPFRSIVIRFFISSLR
nr:MAG TPA: hypothetical protein [Caudoviricetes sp.]